MWDEVVLNQNYLRLMKNKDLWTELERFRLCKKFHSGDLDCNPERGFCFWKIAQEDTPHHVEHDSRSSASDQVKVPIQISMWNKLQIDWGDPLVLFSAFSAQMGHSTKDSQSTIRYPDFRDSFYCPFKSYSCKAFCIKGTNTGTLVTVGCHAQHQSILYRVLPTADTGYFGMLTVAFSKKVDLIRTLLFRLPCSSVDKKWHQIIFASIKLRTMNKHLDKRQGIVRKLIT